MARSHLSHPPLPPFMPGQELSRRFYWEAVRPLLDEVYPDLPHAAGLLGPGSDVLGFDTEMSMDHDWYPRMLIFLRDQDAHLKDAIKEMLSQRLVEVLGAQRTFLGFPVDSEPVPEDPGAHWMAWHREGPVQHSVFPVTLQEFAERWLNWDGKQPLEVTDWLTIPSQVLRSMTAGALHHDGVGEVTAFRQKLAWYPQDIWLYLLAANWDRIGQEEHLAPRAGYVGDELGSAVIAARLVHDLMALGFLMERQYAPYPKWFGTAFQQLDIAAELTPCLWSILQAKTWQEREKALCQAYEILARRHNTLGLTEPLLETVSNFWGRPFKVIHADLFANTLRDQIQDQLLRQIAAQDLIGNIDQISDNTLIRSDPQRWRSLYTLYTPQKGDEHEPAP